MTKETRSEIVQHAIRWTANMLVEVISNHGPIMPRQAREHLKTGVDSLHEALRVIREGE
jgi:hypothetical protein